MLFRSEETDGLVTRDVSSVTRARELAAAINERHPNGVFLLDAFSTSSAIVCLDHPERLMMNLDERFELALENPRAYGVSYVVAVKAQGAGGAEAIGGLDAINMRYPDLYAHGADWCELAEEVGDMFRIYRVVK